MADRFEYKVQRIVGEMHEAQIITDGLNKLAEEGWEVMQVVCPHVNIVMAVCRRRQTGDANEFLEAVGARPSASPSE